MSADGFARALSRLVAEGKGAGLTAEQLVDMLEDQIEAISGADDWPSR